MSVRILVVDDQQFAREGVRQLITTARPNWQICGEAADGEQAVEAVKTLKPEIVVMDISMSRMSGLEATAHIAELNLECRILVFTMHDSSVLLSAALAAGAHGFVIKSRAQRDLIPAIDQILAGKPFFISNPNSPS